MRVRKKLVLLHTVFSIALALVLVVALRPAISNLVRQAEMGEARQLVQIAADLGVMDARSAREFDEGRVQLRAGLAPIVGLDAQTAERLRARPGRPEVTRSELGVSSAAVYDARTDRFIIASVITPEARAAVRRVYILLTIALLAVYLLVAAALEVLVLPRQVYQPIRRLLDADRAVREGDTDRELIDEAAAPSDELGEIMRSRNSTVRQLRTQEAELARALARIEDVAADLKRKNHLLETARRNLEGADRLASLGMMSAGIAHELNTPLSVAKGLVEKLAHTPLTPSEAQLLARVISRLEILSESLLDFARARQPRRERVRLAALADEAAALVRLDRSRDLSRVQFRTHIDPALDAQLDPARMVQVLVNLIRNAAEAARAVPTPLVHVRAACSDRDGTQWAHLIVEDNGPGIDPAAMARLFEPFATTKLDSRGTGLGLAVAEGIVREHAGTLIARNRPEGGAAFEILLPRWATHDPDTNHQSGTGNDPGLTPSPEPLGPSGMLAPRRPPAPPAPEPLDG
jgi:C4-dicarboxylate-specific signal transduction histidine kinase